MLNSKFVVLNKIQESHDTVTLILNPQDGGQRLDFIPGQFVMIHFPDERFGKISKAYSISSIPNSGDAFAITVKGVGNFSNALCGLQIGDILNVKGAFGKFYPTNEMPKLVFLAAGIGITPFYSIIQDYIARRIESDINMFYTNKTKSDIVFFEPLQKIASQFDNIKVIYTITREQVDHPAILESRRIDKEMLKIHLDKLEDYYYFICGTTDFVKQMQIMLKELGVENEKIIVEHF